MNINKMNKLTNYKLKTTIYNKNYKNKSNKQKKMKKNKNS